MDKKQKESILGEVIFSPLMQYTQGDFSSQSTFLLISHSHLYANTHNHEFACTHIPINAGCMRISHMYTQLRQMDRSVLGQGCHNPS